MASAKQPYTVILSNTLYQWGLLKKKKHTPQMRKYLQAVKQKFVSITKNQQIDKKKAKEKRTNEIKMFLYKIL